MLEASARASKVAKAGKAVLENKDPPGMRQVRWQVRLMVSLLHRVDNIFET